MSAFPPIATKLRTSREVRFVPITEVGRLFDRLIGPGPALDNRGTKRWIEVDKSAAATPTSRCACDLMRARWGAAMPARSSSRAAHFLTARARLLATDRMNVSATNGNPAPRSRYLNYSRFWETAKRYPRPDQICRGFAPRFLQTPPRDDALALC